MAMSSELNFKSHSRGGFDYSFNNLEMLSSVKMIWNVTASQIFKKNKQAYVGMKEFLDDNDIIELGTFRLLYRVLRRVQWYGKEKGYIYSIERVDGELITQFDIDASKVGQRVRVKNRKSFDQLFDDFKIYEEPNE